MHFFMISHTVFVFSIFMRHVIATIWEFVVLNISCRNNLENISDDFLFMMDSCHIFAVSKGNR